MSSREGLCVVKVFAIQDPSLPLKTYQDQLTDIKNRLVTAPNVLPFHHSILTDKASLLIRQFIKDNLYDRIRLDVFSIHYLLFYIVFIIIYYNHDDENANLIVLNCSLVALDHSLMSLKRNGLSSSCWVRWISVTLSRYIVYCSYQGSTKSPSGRPGHWFSFRASN